jgi:hypothetical protein
MNEDLLNRLVAYCAKYQNENHKLNAGQWRESIKLVLQGLAIELILTDKQTLKGLIMPAKKKGAKKAKPVAKPMPKKK